MNYVNPRLGKIVVSDVCYSDFWKTPGLKIIPYRVEYRMVDRSYHIECACNLFEKLNKNDAIPRYQLLFKRELCNPLKNNGKMVRTFLDSVEKE